MAFLDVALCAKAFLLQAAVGDKGCDEQWLLESHVVLDGLDAADITSHFNSFVNVGLRGYKPAQLYGALKSLDIDFGGFKGRFTEDGGLCFGRDHRIVKIFAGTLPVWRGSAADACCEQDGGEAQ